MSLYMEWFAMVQTMPARRVLEVGTMGWGSSAPANHRQEIQDGVPGVIWDGLDLAAGDDVTIVCDVHEVADLISPATFDAVLVPAVLEHLRRPWVAADQLATVTKMGGLMFVQTHQTFPYHPYPKDYYRFTREGLEEVFSLDHGWKVIQSGYEYPCLICPKDNIFAHAKDWNFQAESWLNVSLIAERVKRG
jgi:hypothetical protein